MDWLGTLIPLIPGVLLGIGAVVTATVGYWKPTKEAEATTLQGVNKELTELKDTYKHEYEEIRKRFDDSNHTMKLQAETIEELKNTISELKIQIATLKTEINNLKKCKIYFYEALDYIKKIETEIIKKEFIDKLPPMSEKLEREYNKRG